MGGDSPLHSMESRMILSAWFAFSLVIVTSFTANLTVFLGVKVKSAPFETVSEVKMVMEINRNSHDGNLFLHLKKPLY